MRKAKALLLASALFCVSGCSKHPEILGSQIAGADTVVATNVFGAGVSFSGPEAARLVGAVRAATLDAHQDQGVDSAAVSSLRFMRGTNLLAEVMFDAEFLFTGEGRFVDQSHALKSAWEKLEALPPQRQP